MGPAPPARRRLIAMHSKAPPDPALARFFEHYYRRRPVNATFTGVHQHDAQLPDWSVAGLEELTDEMAAVREDVAAELMNRAREQPTAGDDPAAMDHALAVAFLDVQIAEIQSEHFQRRNPALYTGEALFSVISLMLRDGAPLEDRVAAIEARLGGIATFLQGARGTLGGRPVPRSWARRAVAECDAAVHVFAEGLDTWGVEQGLNDQRAREVAKAAKDARTAVLDFRQWIEARPPALPQASGCNPEFYDLLLMRGHLESRPRQDLLAEAREAFEAAEAQLRDMALAQDPGGWPAVADRLVEHHPSVDGYLDAFQQTWDACREVALAHELVTWPDFPIRYVPIPKWARRAAPELYFLYYRSPAPEDIPSVVEYLVPPVVGAPEDLEAKLRATNDHVIKLNHVVHHGAIGHHIQNFHAYRAASRVGRVAAVDCASRIGMFCGGSMAEGWACYATDLMEEVGFLTDLERVAQQHSRLRQLGRAIVDIELHQHTMDEATAQQFYEERVGMTAATAAKEVTRTSMFPGTGIMYWLGTQGIHDLRASRAKAEGSAFSLRAFHDELLSFGSIPVALVAQLMSRAASV